MFETIAALLLAHALADFTLQTNWINANKARPHVMALHGLIVWITAHLALGHVYAPALAALTLAHILIDAAKTYSKFNNLPAFLMDQSAHLATLLAVAVWMPDLWQTGLWAAHPALLPLMALVAGLILCLTAGQYAVGLLMRRHSIRMRSAGLRDGGRQIGLLERGLIFLLVLANQPIGIGFLIAAKSILRYGTANRDQRSAEYVIIGTLASFGWAIAIALGTQSLLSVLPPLEIAPRTP